MPFLYWSTLRLHLQEYVRCQKPVQAIDQLGASQIYVELQLKIQSCSVVQLYCIIS